MAEAGNGAWARAEDDAHVARIVRASGSSFFWALRLLPEQKRRAMFAVYAFCREVDDIADEPGDETEKRRALAAWRGDITALFEGRPQSATTRALLDPVARYRLREEDFLAVIAGMETDAGSCVRMTDEAALDRYCDQVACAVGRISMGVFSGDSGVADRLADALGRALQLTNILRDLEEDAGRNRLYLPEDALLAHGAPATDDPWAVLRDPAAPPVCADLAERAQRFFEEARQILFSCNPADVRPAVVMMEVYNRTLERLLARGWQRWAEPVSVSPLEKLWVAFRYGVI